MHEELKNLERIERYFEGRMEEKERRDFEIAMMVDPELQQESELYRKMVGAIQNIKAEEVRMQLKDIESGLDRKRPALGPRVPGRIQRILLVAVLVLGIGSTLFLLQKNTSGPTIHPDLLPVEEGLPVLMGTAGEKAFDDAMSLFKAGDYGAAYTLFGPLLDLHQGNDTLLYYTGNALLRSGRAGDALPLFNRLSASHSLAFREKAEVYVALCNWETGAKQQALNRLREISLLENHPYKSEASTLFELLSSGR